MAQKNDFDVSKLFTGATPVAPTGQEEKGRKIFPKEEVVYNATDYNGIVNNSNRSVKTNVHIERQLAQRMEAYLKKTGQKKVVFFNLAIEHYLSEVD